MIKNRIGVLFLWMTVFHGTIDSQLVPPQPSQYTTSILLNGRPAMYYADTTINKDRIDQSNQITIIDFKDDRQYVIVDGDCSWSQIPGKIQPLLAFTTYDFNGNVTHNKLFCYQWSGCHNYEIPPAPFYYYATVNESLPVDLILPTIDINIHFSNFTFAPPPLSLFDIPNNCTESTFNPMRHPILSRMRLNKNNVKIIC